MTKAIDTRELIAGFNDLFRQSPVPQVPGMKTMTRGIAALDDATRLDIWLHVAEFDSFTEDNDPHGEHDFGAFDHPKAGKVFWKIDTFGDARCEFGSEHPEDPARSYRVLTIMLASEY